MSKTKTACIVVIGDEILSGRTKDTNTNTIACALQDKGITLKEVRVIRDDVDMIADAVNALRAQADTVLTTGGIGPTHDDKTAQAIARAFDVDLVLNEEAFETMAAHYGGAEHMNKGRTRMAMIPQGASLIVNPLSSAPGFRMENVHVLAGVPAIMRAMLDAVLPTLEGGDIVHSRTLETASPESEIAELLEDFQNRHPELAIGSYPRYDKGFAGVRVVLRSTDKARLEHGAAALSKDLARF